MPTQMSIPRIVEIPDFDFLKDPIRLIGNVPPSTRDLDD